MSLVATPLPENIDELRVFAASLQTRYRVLEDELYAKTLHIEKLKAQLAALRRARFGRSSEKLDHEIEQMELQLGELEEGQAECDARQAVTVAPQAESAPQQKRTPPVRKPLTDPAPGLIYNISLSVLPQHRLVAF